MPRSIPNINGRGYRVTDNLVALKQFFLRGGIQEQVAFVREFTPKARTKDAHRVWLNVQEYHRLKDPLRENIRLAEKQNDARVQDAEELKDYVIFMVNSGPEN